jgi:hypothetical protein
VEAENGTQAWYILQESDSPRLCNDWMMPAWMDWKYAAAS